MVGKGREDVSVIIFAFCFPLSAFHKRLPTAEEEAEGEDRDDPTVAVLRVHFPFDTEFVDQDEPEEGEGEKVEQKSECRGRRTALNGFGGHGDLRRAWEHPSALPSRETQSRALMCFNHV